MLDPKQGAKVKNLYRRQTRGNSVLNIFSAPIRCDIQVLPGQSTFTDSEPNTRFVPIDFVMVISASSSRDTELYIVQYRDARTQLPEPVLCIGGYPCAC
jgi:hypothetical protein